MIRKLMTGAGYAAWGIAVFGAGFYLFFPSERAADRVAWESSERTDQQWQVQSERAKPWRLTGVKLTQVNVLKREEPRRRGGDEPVTATSVLKMDRAAARLRILPALTLTPDVAFDVDLYGGDVGGHVAIGDIIVVDAEVSDVELSRIPIVGESWEVDLGGELSSEISLTLNKEDIKESSGRISLDIEGLELKSGTVAGFDLPQNSFESASVKIKVKDGKAKVNKGEIVSELVTADIDGTITLNKNLIKSRLRLDVTFKIEESMDAMLKVFLKDARTGEGEYAYQVTGTFERPSFRGKSRKRPSRRTPSTRKSPSPVVGGDEALDERRRLREERIRERRERLQARRDTKQDEPDDMPMRDEGIDDDPMDEPGYDEEEFFDDPGFDEGMHPPPGDFQDDVEMNPVPYEEFQE